MILQERNVCTPGRSPQAPGPLCGTSRVPTPSLALILNKWRTRLKAMAVIPIGKKILEA